MKKIVQKEGKGLFVNTKREDGTLVVSRTVVQRRKTIESSETQKTIKVRPFVTEPAYVEASYGRTEGRPNYSSDRVQVTVRMPCYKEEVEKVMAEVCDYARSVLEQELSEFDYNDVDK